jgi:hypothetical protein
MSTIWKSKSKEDCQDTTTLQTFVKMLADAI